MIYLFLGAFADLLVDLLKIWGFIIEGRDFGNFFSIQVWVNWQKIEFEWSIQDFYCGFQGVEEKMVQTSREMNDKIELQRNLKNE